MNAKVSESVAHGPVIWTIREKGGKGRTKSIKKLKTQGSVVVFFRRIFWKDDDDGVWEGQPVTVKQRLFSASAETRFLTEY